MVDGKAVGRVTMASNVKQIELSEHPFGLSGTAEVGEDGIVRNLNISSINIINDQL